MALLVFCIFGCTNDTTTPLNVLSPNSEVSLCDLQINSERYKDQSIQTSGWIYTDIESSFMQNQKCGVLLNYPVDKELNANLEKSIGYRGFEQNLMEAKNGTVNTDGQVFATIRGRFEILPPLKRKESAGRTQGWGRFGTIPNRLVVQEVICSKIIPMSDASLNTECTKPN